VIYLSRLILNPPSPAVRRDLADCQNLHRTVMRLFPAVETAGAGAREMLGVLFRLEPTPRSGGPPTLLLQSAVLPDWPRLPPGYLIPADGDRPNPACKPVGDRYAAIAAGTVLRFRLRANPTRKVDTASGPDGARRNGRRVPLRGDVSNFAWLAGKGIAGGFEIRAVQSRPEVPAAQAAPAGQSIGWRPAAGGDGAKATRLTFDAVVFEGTLAVTDRERFLDTLARGVGPAKAYGFGLLSVALPRE
jgi:CRISPR system Cascade subunit CasE